MQFLEKKKRNWSYFANTRPLLARSKSSVKLGAQLKSSKLCQPRVLCSTVWRRGLVSDIQNFGWRKLNGCIYVQCRVVFIIPNMYTFSWVVNLKNNQDFRKQIRPDRIIVSNKFYSNKCSEPMLHNLAKLYFWTTKVCLDRFTKRG
jgi:hypothetical protein